MIYVKKYYRKIIIILIPFLVLFIFIQLYKNKTENVINSDLIEKNDEKLIDENINYDKKINIKGAVVNPGVYNFIEGERVIDAINKSGGLLENADTSVINLSKNLFDEMVIVIYTVDEVNEMRGNNILIQYVEKDCNCPSLSNDACLSNDSVKESGSFKISINNASIEELTSLSGIGESKARAIIEYRSEHGLFSNIEEILNVSGIGEALFEKIKDNITI